MLEIRLFGHGQAFFKGRALAGFPCQQPCALFCYLLLNRQVPHYREHLAAVFWGDSPATLARKYLRNNLWRLRQSFQSFGGNLDEYLSIDESSVTFLSSSNLWVDIEVFHNLTHPVLDQPSQALTEKEVSNLETAIELYMGDLLEGIYEDWCLYERERLRLVYLNALSKLMIFHGFHGNYERGINYGKRILILDNTREKVHRNLMWIHWMAGNREAALAQYRQCCQVLQEELGVFPMKETQRLYETIQRTQSLIAADVIQRNEELSYLEKTNAAQSTKEVMQKLQVLKMIVEQTNVELRLLERMIQRALTEGE